MKNIVILAVVLLSPFVSYAQFGDLLKKTAQKALDKGKTEALKSSDASRDKLDSTDFNYAISVIDNSGMMSIRDANEGLTKKVDFVLNTQVKDQSKVTPAQKA